MKRLGIIETIACLLTASAASARDVVSSWSGPAPEDLPAVNVRYEDAARHVLIVEGADYRARVRLRPAEILSLEVNGREQLAAPMVPGFVDDQGVRYVPQGEGVPNWMTYQGQSYKPARSAAARVNVWNAAPHYWDAHVLDIPLVPEKKAAAPLAEKGTLLKGWSFEDGVQEWGNPVNQSRVTLVDGALRVEYEGDDPWFNAPPCHVDGPLEVVVRLRSETGGTAQLYYATGRAGYGEDTRLAFEVEGGWQWQEVRIPWHVGERLNRFRIDPPGEAGVVELSHVELRQVDASVLAGPVVRGGIVLHAFADRLNIEFHVDPEDTEVVPARASWAVAAPGITADELEGRPLVQLADVAILGLPGPAV